ncbi:MAG TPA: alternative ribosome rescue aminoacyl-tRNA hydrolase ArfB [Gemmatimonadaceae bacterium]|nr:alternative ribosome rescue aminoacyl-tRNA hydrolase ArfB [Gemmatimonadaceae bacterium]
MNALVVNESVAIPRSELDVRVSRSSGAGGQHVNKTSSRVEIFWNVVSSKAVSDEERARLLDKLESRLTTEGSIRVVASDMRSQSRNRELAEERLAELVRRALVIPRKRRPTKPTRASKEARLEEKKRQARKKRDRQQKSFD